MTPNLRFAKCWKCEKESPMVIQTYLNYDRPSESVPLCWKCWQEYQRSEDRHREEQIS